MIRTLASQSAGITGMEPPHLGLACVCLLFCFVFNFYFQGVRVHVCYMDKLLDAEAWGPSNPITQAVSIVANYR